MDKYTVIIIVGAFFLISFMIHISSKRKLISYLSSTFGKLPSYEFRKADNEKFLRKTFRVLRSYNKPEHIIDDLTWYDLDMSEVYKKINMTKSSIGAEALYYRLRTPKDDIDDELFIKSLIDYFESHDDIRLNVQYRFAKLGKLKEQSVLEYLVNNKGKDRSNLLLHSFMGLVSIISLIMLVLNVSQYALLIFIMSIIANFTYTIKNKGDIDSELDNINYIIRSLNVIKKLDNMGVPVKDELVKEVNGLKFLNLLSSMTMPTGGSESDLIGYYLSTMFMLSFISYDIVVKKVRESKDKIVYLWKEIGDIEAAIAILNYRKSVDYYCEPTFINEKQIVAKDVYHPLIKKPVANNVLWTRNTIVSGSNASGKSTYVKSVAINLIYAQTIYICLANRFDLKRGNILTSMAIKDNVIEGDSYFIAEVKSLKRIVTDLDKNDSSYYFIDEILKGTNTIERIAASSSIIEYFIENNALSFVATHDIELTKMHTDKVDNIHFREIVTEDNQIEFDYKVFKGASMTKNAIKLLDIIEFPKEIVNKAESKVNSFLENRNWE